MKEHKIMKRSIPFIIFLAVTIIFLSVIQVTVSSKLSITGIELGKLQGELANYERENSVLTENLLLTTSLTNIASNASEIGFVEQKSIVYLTTPLPLAVKR